MEIAGRVGNCERAAAGRCDTAALRLSLELLHRLDAAVAKGGMLRDRTDFGSQHRSQCDFFSTNFFTKAKSS